MYAGNALAAAAQDKEARDRPVANTIAMEVNELEGLLACMIQTVDEHEKKLDSVMRPPFPPDGPASDTRNVPTMVAPPRSNTAQRLTTLKHEFGHVMHRLAVLTSRVDE